MNRPPPGPQGNLFLGSLPDLTADWLGFMARCERQHGSVVRFRMPWPLGQIVVVTDPALIERIFIDDADSFRKPMAQRMVAPVIGNGLLLAEGETWKRQRRMVQPAFHRTKVAEYADEMASCAEAMMADWQTGTERNVYADATKLTLRIAAKTLFGAALGEEADRASRALTEALAAFDDYFNSRLPLPLTVPTPRGLRIRRASKALEALVYDLIAERERTNEDGGDLLSMLLRVRDEDGSRMTREQVRDEAVTAFAAGSETTAVALGWTFLLLAQHPDVADRVRSEVAHVTRGDRVRLEHLPALRFTERVVKESMRLYPPGWFIAREALRDYVLGGFTIPRGAQVFASPYLVQRNARLFSNPEKFYPDRWTDEFAQSLPKFAYFPFGGGKRMCIGSAFAMMELVVTVATVVQRVRFELTHKIPEPRPSFTLRPRDGVNLRVVLH